MVKKLQAKLLLLLAVMLGGASTAWAADKITDKDNIVSGQKYYIGATTGNTDYYLSVNGSQTSQSIAGTAVTSATSATPFLFEASNEGWTVKFESGNYLSLKSSRDNGKVVVSNTASTFTASNQSSKLRLSLGDFSIQKNNSGTQFGSYGNTQTDIWLEAIVDDQRTPTTLSIANVIVEEGDMAELQVSTNSDGTVTYEVDDKSIAEIDEGVVYAYKVGTTTVTATQSGSTTYQDATCKFTITVKKAPRVAAFNEVFYESFDQCESTGGNDGKWSSINPTGDIVTDNENAWTFSNGVQGSACAKFGTSKAGGSASLTLQLAAGSYTLSFLAGAWDGNSEATSISLTATGATLDNNGSVSLTKGKFEKFTTVVTVETAGIVALTFAGSKGNNRFFLDDVLLAVTSLSKEVTAHGWAGYTPAYAVSFGSEPAYVVTEASLSGLMLQEVSAVPAGTPVLLKDAGTKNMTVVDPANAAAPAGNLLVVYDGSTDVEGSSAYVLAKSGETGACFKKWTGDMATLPGHIVLWIANSVASARNVFVLGDETDAVSTATLGNETTADCYDLQGRRLSQPTKGLYIVNGKKVIIK